MNSGKKLERVSLSSQIQREIRAQILRGNMQPGDALRSEGQIAADLGVGRNSVREAVKALESLGVVEARSGSGLFVGPLTLEPLIESLPLILRTGPDELVQLVEVRLTLETGMVRQMVHGATPERLAALDEILSQWDEVSQHGTYPDELDKQFHVILAECAENGILARLSDVFWQVSSLAIADRRLVLPRDPRQTYLRHVPIYEALRTVNEASLAAALADHYGGVLDRARDVRQAADDGASR